MAVLLQKRLNVLRHHRWERDHENQQPDGKSETTSRLYA